MPSMTNHLAEYKSDLMLSGLADSTIPRYYKWVKEFVEGQDVPITEDNIEQLITDWMKGPAGQKSTQFKKAALHGYARTVFGIDPTAKEAPDYTPILSVMQAVRDLAPRWMDKGACKGHDTKKVFFSDLAIKEAKAICNGGCPVKNECLSFAMENHEWGVWGGTSREDRRKMRKVIKSGDSGSSVG